MSKMAGIIQTFEKETKIGWLLIQHMMENLLCSTRQHYRPKMEKTPWYHWYVHCELVKALEYKVRPYELLFSWYAQISEGFWGARIGNCDIKPTDGTTIFTYLRKGESGIDWFKKERWKMIYNW